MTEFNEEAFLDWLREQDGYYMNDTMLREKWPGFYDNYDLVGVTMKMDEDTGETLVPIRDYRQAVKFGQPLD